MKDQTKHCLKYTSLFLSTFAAKMVILLGACLWFDWEPDFVVYPLIFIIVSSFTWIIAAIGEMKSEVKGKLFNLESKMDEIQRDLSRNEESGMTEEEIKEKSRRKKQTATLRILAGALQSKGRQWKNILESKTERSLL